MKKPFVSIITIRKVSVTVAMLCAFVGPVDVRAHQQGTTQLEQQLPSGQTPNFYRDRLAELGYTITGVTHNAAASYAAYEVVKNGQTYNIYLILGGDNGRAREVKITPGAGLANPVGTTLPASSAENSTAQQTLLRHQIERLQRHMPPGQRKSFYRERLADRGWRISAINDDDPTYTEYEVVRGNLTAEVQMKTDRETGRVIQVSVVENPIRRETTERELARNQRVARLAGAESSPGETASRRMAEDSQGTSGTQTAQSTATLAGSLPSTPSAFSFAAAVHYSDRARVRIERLLQELSALPVGQRRGFYRNALEQRGYDIKAVHLGPLHHVRYNAVKDSQPVMLTIVFDDETNTSVALSAMPLPAGGQKSMETTRAEKKSQQSSSQLN